VKNLSSQAFYVGSYLVEPSLNQISKNKNNTQLPPKVMSALVLFAESEGQTISHQQLLSALWPQQVVSDSSLYQVIATLRKSFGDTEAKRSYIEKVSGKGYRLIARVKPDKQLKNEDQAKPYKGLIIGVLASVLLVSGYWLFNLTNTTKPSLSTASLAANQIKSLTILPFKDQFNNVDHSALANGLSDALMTQLVRVKDLTIIRAQSVTSPENHDSTDNTSEALLLGRIQSQAGQLRVNLQLQSSSDQSIIWAREFEGNENSLFELQDKITKVLLALFEKIQNNGSFTQLKIDQKHFNQYLFARFHWSKRSSQSLQQAELLFKSVIDKAPDFALAYVGLCDTYQYHFIYGDRQFAKML